MIKDIFNFLIDNNDKLLLTFSDTSKETTNTYIYTTTDGTHETIILTTDKHTRPLSIDII